MEEFQFRSLLNLIGNAFIPRDGKDRRIWMPSADDIFSIVSFFSMNKDVVVTRINWASLWSMEAAPRVIVFW